MMALSHVVVAPSRNQRRSLRTRLVSQFGHPRGIAGRLAGWVMAHRRSNRWRNAWTVDLLDLQPGGRVLEIGFGPGLSLHWIASRVGTLGFVAGIDLSDTMLSQAQHRNRVAVASGRMDLRVASVTDPPDFGASFDAVLAVNTIGFWPDPASRFREIRERLIPGGRFAVTMQPRSKGATAATHTTVATGDSRRNCAPLVSWTWPLTRSTWSLRRSVSSGFEEKRLVEREAIHRHRLSGAPHSNDSDVPVAQWDSAPVF